jgi:hypothetical protein
MVAFSISWASAAGAKGRAQLARSLYDRIE